MFEPPKDPRPPGKPTAAGESTMWEGPATSDGRTTSVGGAVDFVAFEQPGKALRAQFISKCEVSWCYDIDENEFQGSQCPDETMPLSVCDVGWNLGFVLDEFLRVTSKLCAPFGITED